MIINQLIPSLPQEIQVENLLGEWETIYSHNDPVRIAFKKRHLQRTNPMDRFRVLTRP